jgi:four helix bundle protein
VRNYRDLKVWEKAHHLTITIYRASKSFPREELFGLTSQMRRSSMSIGANLAEGCGRRSDGEMCRFVQIALGSATELSYHLLLARDLNFLDEGSYERLHAETDEISRMLSSLSESVQIHTGSSERLRAKG